jgi:hypothetical protein
MSETRYIKVQAYRDPQKRPTCRTKAGGCCFLGLRKLTTPTCTWVYEDVSTHDGSDFLKPVEACPVWSQS